MTIQQFGISFYFLLFSFCTSAQSEKSNYNSERMQAVVNRDSVKLDALIATDAVIIHSNGLMENKQEHIHNIMSGKIIYSEMKVTEQTTKLYNETKIVTGIVEVSGKYDGKDYHVKLRFIEVDRLNKSQWQLINWQSTKMN